jgi:predicted ATPase/DNA-binding SARP family transcriptional activator
MPTSPLTLRLLGAPLILLDHQPVEGLPSRTAEALLVYLALQEHPVSREFLAEFLWSERTQDQALANLRSILSSLRKAMGDYVLTTRQRVTFNRELPFTLDVAEFEREMARHTSQTPLKSADAASLETALNLYGGDFLEGFYVREGRGFEEWAALLRERLRRTAHAGFRTLVRHLFERANYPAGIHYAEKLLAVDPFDEDSCRQLMHLYLRNGQPTAALQTYTRLRRLLENELHVEPAPATRALYERVRALPFPPPVRLPPDPTPFLGRETEIETVWQVLPDHRLVTLFGPGGIGKTRLSIEVARRFAQHRPGQFLDGIFFIPLATAQTAQELPTNIAEEIGFHFRGTDAPLTQLLAHLREKEMLLILDNFEPFLSEGDAGTLFLVEMLSKAPQVKLILTSRERVNLYEEVVFDLPGLALPDPTSENPETFSAVALFAQTARRVKTGFAITDENTATLVQICRLLDGTPLALELAASWVRQYSLAQIYRNLQESLDFLQASYRNLPKRHRSLRAVFDHSWELLAPPEQAIFSQLAIFEGAFSPEAASSVVSFQSSVFSEASELHPAHWSLTTDHYLASLADKSLLQPQPEGRYVLHPLLRQFAAEKQAEYTGVLDTAPQRHADYYLHFVTQQGSGEDTAQRAALRAALPNIRAAWQFAAQKHALAQLESAAVILHNFFSIQSWFLEGLELFAFALAHIPDENPPTSAFASALCELLSRKARMHIHIGQMEAARPELERAVSLMRYLDDPDRRSVVLGYLAITHYYAGDYTAAITLAQESQQLSEETQNPEGLAFAQNFLGSCYKSQGNYVRARASFEQAVKTYKAYDDSIGAAMVLNNLGNLAQAMKDFDGAQAYYQECAALFKTHDHIHGAATTLANAGKLALRQGQFETARALLEESLTLKQQLNDQRGVAVARVSLGDLAVRTGAPAQARAHYAQSLSLAHGSGDIRLALEILAAVLEFWVNLGESERAASLWAFICQHPALSQEARERGEKAAEGLGEVEGGKGTLEEVVDEVLEGL